MKISSNNITALKKNEVFVFGSNLAGNHAGGAARFAAEQFGAETGVGEGLTGQTYAFPTLTETLEKRAIIDIAESAAKLLSVVRENPRKQFLITEVGCGIAGFTPEEIAPVFQGFFEEDNVSLPLSFLEIIGIKGYKAFNPGMKCRDKEYAENTLFEEDVKPVPCETGMHFCPSPLDVFGYYDHHPQNVYAEVVAVGKTAKDGDKVTTNRLKVKGKLKFTDLVKAHFCIVKETVKKAVEDVKAASETANTAGDNAHANTAGDNAHANTAGYNAHANTAGDNAHANTAGDNAHANTAGNYAHANTAGYKAHANTAGNESIASALGIHSKASAQKGWIVVVDWHRDEENNWYIHEIYRAKVGKHKIKGVPIQAGVWYWVEGGELKSEKQ